MIVFLAGSLEGSGQKSDYFSSKECVREFREAIGARKPTVLVLETDSQHGGEGSRIRTLPSLVRPRWLHSSPLTRAGVESLRLCRRRDGDAPRRVPDRAARSL